MKKSLVVFLSLIISTLLVAQTENATKQNKQTVVKPSEKNKVENKSSKDKSNTAKKSNINKPIEKKKPANLMRNKAVKMEKAPQNN